ncbi:MAG: hypothetical protein ACLFSE_12175 [Spirochaetia bacterium]
MGYWDYVIANPFFWCFAAAIPLGAAFSWMTIRVKRRKNPSGARKRKWTAVPLLFAAAILILLTGTFLSDPEVFLSPFTLAVFGSFVLFFTLSIRIKWFGFFFGVLILAAISVGAAVFHPVPAAAENITAAELRVLSAVESSSLVEIDLPYKSTEHGDAPGDFPLFFNFSGNVLRVKIEVFTFHPAYFFLGKGDFFWVQSVRGYAGEEPADDPVILHPAGITPEIFSRLFDPPLIPGLQKKDLTLTLDIEVLREYRIYFEGMEDIRSEIR